LGEQEELRMHHDVAQVSASIKLNNDYEGAELEFPRQGFTNADVPVGDLLAWPSMVTHQHASRPLTKGVKYSLTIWCELPMVLG
jgi:predicted 2-oxoglutarate/Fe(II)-dependent dioxygenase YbiX